MSGAIKEERYKDLCRLVIEAFSKHEGTLQNEALGAFNAIVREFRAHRLHLFESMLQTDKKTRLKIFKVLEVVDDNAISAAADDGQILNFFKHCLVNVQPSLMEWLMPTACVDDLQMLVKIEQQPLSEEEKLEEDINSYALALLRRLYRLASITFDQSVWKYDALLMDKVVTLAYMGHKRQRGPALKVLQQAIATDSATHVRKNWPELWEQYKANLQSIYYKRMLLLVAACDLDWTTQWNTTIQFIGTDLHRGAGLINNLLSVEEKAFKSIDPIIRRQAFLSWKLLIDNFALDYQELATARRIKLLCIPLNAKNSKTELIALTKLEVWWHLIIKLYKHIAKFVSPVITQFLNYCFGPLGDTPLLSAKFDVVASPGKRFFKTKVVAVDALCQLLVTKEDLFTVCPPMLEERLPHAMSYEVFKECSQSIIHSIAEAVLILGQLTDKEMKNRFQLGETLWKSLMIYIRKDQLYRDVIIVVTELTNHIDKLMVRDMLFNVILPDVYCIIEKTEVHDNALPELVLKLLTSPILDEMLKYILDYNSNTIKCLLERCVSPEFTYSSGVFGFLETIMGNLKSAHDAYKNKGSNELAYIELWSMITEIFTQYIRNSEISKDDVEVIKSILSFPFYTNMEDLELIKNQATVWKTVYKEVELRSDSIAAIKPNEILLDTASMMRKCLSINRECCTLIVNCLDTLLSTLDYESLLDQDEIPSIMQLIMDVIIISFNDVQNLNSEIALKALSAMLITIYGHNLPRVVSYLHNCKSIIKLVLSSQTTVLFKEVANTWEYIVSIFKGLNKQLDHKLLSSYKEAIVIAMNHPNLNIRSLTQSIFEIKDNLDSTAKCILDEIKKPKGKSHAKSDSASKKKAEAGQAKEVHVAGSFLNRKSATTKSAKPPEKNDKNTLPTLSEPESQDYVYIKTDLKFDVNRLTEHQKETLKRKREDIPALYNDLSQSSSQNSQNLQQWFDIKAKHINEIDKVNNKKGDSTMQKSIDSDANKENKVTLKQIEISNATDKSADDICGIELEGNVGENTVNTKQNEISTKKVKNDESNGKQDMSKQANLSSHAAAFSGKNATTEGESADAMVSVAKKLDFESRDEFPEDQTHERQSSPSMLDSIKRRHRNSTTKFASSLKDDETVETSKDSSTTNVQKTLRVKTTQEKPGTNSKRKSDDATDDSDDTVKENSNENKKGVKRKYASDTESEESVQCRKRKVTSLRDLNDDGGETSRSADNVPDSMNQRMRNEISRLKIDMVFTIDSGANRRRVKHRDEGERETVGHGLRKYGTYDRCVRLKSVDAKSADGLKRTPRMERTTKDIDDMEQGVCKRRSRRSKQESNKNDLDVTKDVEKSNDSSDKAELTNTDTDVTLAIPTSNQAVQDVNKVQEQERLDKDNLKSDSNVTPAELAESNEQSQEEGEDVVESSQVPNVCLKLDKLYGEKQCFIKINKMTNIQAAKTSDATVDKRYVPESIPMDCGDNDNVPDPCEELDEAEPDVNTKINDEEVADSIDKDSVQKTDNSNVKSLISEGQKIIDNSASIKSTSVNFTSPRSNSKVLYKLKPFTGRAAHMLGLVTSQARLVANDIVLDEEPSKILDDLKKLNTESSKMLDDSKKLKTKDVENEMSMSKKTSMVKEIDKIGGPSGSRQEKIFSNMRSTDYAASSSAHTFTTLKNDGEKLSFRFNKSAPDCATTDSSIDKENDKNASPLRERNDLPILEWSSANPPSLTASPSVSILKRRSSLPEADLDLTPKRKRVSFADPPVSKEMGYEISTAETTPKGIKYSLARNSTSRKDSPSKFKQTKLKLVPFDTEKINVENIAEDNIQNKNGTEAMEVEKKKEAVVKISEAYSEPADIDEQTPSDSPENGNAVENILEMNPRARIDVIGELELAQEIEITTDSVVSEDQQSISFEDSGASPIDIETEDTETQRDIFDGMDAKVDVTVIQADNDGLIPNNSVDSIKLNVTNDSVIAALPTKDNDPTSMEDTMDIQNIIGLNSTVNTDEIFCEKPIRSSTQATENIAELDTMPITDSVSLSTMQDTQSQEAAPSARNVERNPESLDSTQPIYPALSSCMEPVASITERLTYPLWKQNLSTFFANRNIHTIGDIADLSEREIDRMPVKGKPKTEFVRKVLKHFESTCMLRTKESSAEKSSKVEQLPVKATDEIVPIAVLSNVEMGSAANDNESLTCSTPLIQPIGNTSDSLPSRNSSVEDGDKTESVTSDMDISLGPTIPYHPDLLALNTSIENGQTSAKLPIAAQNSKPGTSTDNPEPVPIPSSSSESITTTSQTTSTSNVSLDARKDPAGVSSVYDELLITHSSIGTNTDEIGSTTPAVKQSTKSVASQMTLAELLDEIDVNLVMESAAKRCNPEAVLLQYKIKMAHVKEGELLKETIKMLGLQDKQQVNDASLKAACRACGVNKVLLRLPDIFSHDKQFFDKVLKFYSKKLNIADGLNSLDFNKLKSAICQRCTSSDIIEILSEKLKQEEKEGIKQSMPELSSLNAMLQRLPMDVIISHTVANEELIPASVVLDIALQNNSSEGIAQALEQSPGMAKRVLDQLWTSQFMATHIQNNDVSKESLLSIFKSVCSKMTAQELLDAYHEAMSSKFNNTMDEKDVKNVKK
ncbi:PREDICTED: telomere-associated protein RIF1-like isoform X2 [Vollenhovia emeryi]|nr:PREDICTED: telomere-associated protein RIF1-like isoform X2 [Vollenhovia emeryi]